MPSFPVEMSLAGVGVAGVALALAAAPASPVFGLTFDPSRDLTEGDRSTEV